eukprot:GGOE01018903.1.p1 GENE.GGOE01018903.1~~GGOE01018903.1.p1  ORF type:complete len:597 (-),score=82.44 GGOE01018903.1:429-2219(-)
MLLFLLCVVGIISALWLCWILYVRLTSLSRTTLRNSYDYIVVGAGSAGCVVASRLSERPDVSVLLLEAGGDDRETLISKVRIPLLAASLPKTHADWKHRTTMQAELKNRRLDYPSGKLIGGTSNLSWMTYVRGNRQDYDDWAKMGCKGWDYQALLPYFLKSETNYLGTEQSPFHEAPDSKPGPITVSYPLPPSPLAWAFVQSATTAGLPGTLDYNGVCQDGVSLAQTNVSLDGSRSTATRFLPSSTLRRANLTVKCKATVKRVLFEGNRAAGVLLQTPTGEETIVARREVILCCGTFGSPSLLMVSGVGPRPLLDALNIPVVYDSPAVGANLRDQVMLPVVCQAKPGLTYDAHNVCSSAFMWQYLVAGKGPFRSPGIEAMAFIDTHSCPLILSKDQHPVDGGGEEGVRRLEGDLPSPGVGRPNVSLQVGCGGGWGGGIGHRFGCPSGLFDAYPEAMTLLVTLLRPRSVGRLTLEGSGGEYELQIDPAYFSNPVDSVELQAGLDAVEAILKEPPLCQLLTGKHTQYEVTEDGQGLTLRRAAMPGFNAVGTCAMCPMDGRPAVVTPAHWRSSGSGDCGWRTAPWLQPRSVAATLHWRC